MEENAEEIRMFFIIDVSFPNNTSHHRMSESNGSILTKLMKFRLEWLGHLTRMSDQITPKRILFSWLKKT